MININELRPAVKVAGLNAISMQEVLELLDRLEAAESDALEQARLNGIGASREAALMAKLEAAEKEAAHIKEVEFPRKVRAVAAGWETKCARIEQERDALRARIEEMEKQGPAMWVNSSNIISAKINRERGSIGDQHTCSETKTAYHDAPLYALPGAQPTPSIPEGWLRAIDEALVVAHIGVANADDTYEQAKAKLNNLIGFHVDVAADPAVNGGWKLVPIEPTETMIGEGSCASSLPGPHYISEGCAQQCWKYMIAAAPEAKP